MNHSLRQSMTWLHTWTGLLFCWLLYFMFATGSLGYFDSEIDVWMQPEISQVKLQNDEEIMKSIKLGVRWAEENLKTAKRWLILPPTNRDNPYLEVIGQVTDPITKKTKSVKQLLDGITGEPLKARDTGGGQVLYSMHYLLHYLPTNIGYRFMGIVTLFMFIGMISGIIVHKKIFKDFFTFRRKKGQRSWLDMHNLLSVTTLPFQLMISYSGLIFIITMWMPFIGLGSYGFDISKFKEGLSQLSRNVTVETSQTPLKSINWLSISQQSKELIGINNIRLVDIKEPNDANAKVVITKKHDSVSRYSQRLTFDAAKGTLINNDNQNNNTALAVSDVFLGLHEGLYANTGLRWLYFISGLLGMAMIGTGAIYWGVKRDKSLKADEKNHGHALVSQLNIGTIIGLPIGIAAYFWANRLLPADMVNRANWEVHVMFIVWLLALLYPLIRSKLKAWIDQLYVAAFAFAALPVINSITTGRHIFKSFKENDWIFVGFDLTSLSVGLICAISAYAINKRAINKIKNPTNIMSEI